MYLGNKNFHMRDCFDNVVKLPMAVCSALDGLVI